MTSPTLRSLPMFERRNDVLAHPGTARLPRDANRRRPRWKREDPGHVALVDHRDLRSEPAGIEDGLDDVLQPARCSASAR